MQRAISLAQTVIYTTDPNPRVGCVIVLNKAIVGEGATSQAGGPHAEINALNEAGNKAQGASAFVTLEPCCHFGKTPPCVDALINAGIKQVCIAMVDPNPKVAGKGISRLKQSGITVVEGICVESAYDLNKGFVKRFLENRPWVRIKHAISLDGHTAMSDGESKWITGKESRIDVHKWRAQSSAVITGSGTIKFDNPRMNARLDDHEIVQPIRIIVSNNADIDPSSAIFDQPGHILIACSSISPFQQNKLERSHVEIVQINQGEGGVCMESLLDRLIQWEINEVWIESGPGLSATIIKHKLFDELFVYMAPCIMGNNTRPMTNIDDIHKLSDKIQLEIHDVKRMGKDLRMVFRS